MPVTKDARIDDYIRKVAPFARPILARLRKTVHAGCPDCVETVKWGHPSFVLDGRIFAGMAAFKEHATFGFWNHEKLKEQGLLPEGAGSAMGQLGRLASVDDLPSEAKLLRAVKAAVTIHAQPAARRAKPKGARTLEIPADLEAALRKNRKARATFDAFSFTNKREYVEWIATAKREETRARRLATAIEWMSEGKPHGWRYLR